jgi:hypothetical protein
VENPESFGHFHNSDRTPPPPPKPKKTETPETNKVEVVETPDELYEEFGKDGWTELPPVETQEKPRKKYEVTGIRTDNFGEFYFDKKFNSIDWRTEEGDEIGMSPLGWKNLINELPDIMRELGVDV